MTKNSISVTAQKLVKFSYRECYKFNLFEYIYYATFQILRQLHYIYSYSYKRWKFLTFKVLKQSLIVIMMTSLSFKLWILVLDKILPSCERIYHIGCIQNPKMSDCDSTCTYSKVLGQHLMVPNSWGTKHQGGSSMIWDMLGFCIHPNILSSHNLKTLLHFKFIQFKDFFRANKPCLHSFH